MIGVKIFSGEGSIGLPPAQLQLIGGWVLDFNLTAGVVIWPVVFITTDIINEYFGRSGVKRISYMTVVFIAYIYLVIIFVIRLEPAQFWLDVNSTDADGNYFNINFAFRKIFGQGAAIIVASMVAFLIGQLLDVLVFHRLRRITGQKHIWFRATGSTLVSQLVDSFVVLSVAFYFLQPEETRWTWTQVVSVGMINYIYKFGIAILITPLLYVAHYLIDGYLGKELSEQMMEEAAASS